jgi:drug/metabolite transporter (DMT)-like permease
VRYQRVILFVSYFAAFSAKRNFVNKSAHDKAWSYAALVTAIFCIAWSAIFVRWTSIPGPASAFYRCLIPAIVLLPTWFLPGTRPQLSLRSYAIIAIGGFFFALDLAFYNTSILQTSAANSTLLGNNTPIIVGLLTWLLFRRRPAFSFWIGLALALAGSAVIMGADLAKHPKFGLGDVMALAAAACFAVYLIATEEIRSHTTTLEFLRLAILSSTIFMFIFTLILRTPLLVPDRRTLLALLGLGLVSQLGGYLALTYALGHLPATVTSVSLLSQGPLTAVLAALLLGEPLTGYQIGGGALVLFGVGLANHLGRPESEVNAAFGETAESGAAESTAGDDVAAYAPKKLS